MANIGYKIRIYFFPSESQLFFSEASVTQKSLVIDSAIIKISLLLFGPF